MTLQQAIELKAMIGILGSLYVIMGQNESPASTKKALEQHQLVNDFITRLVDKASVMKVGPTLNLSYDQITQHGLLLTPEQTAALAQHQPQQEFTYRGFKIITNPAVPPGELWIQQSGRAQRMSHDDIDAHHRAMITPFFNDLAG